MRKTTGPARAGVMGRWSIFRDKRKGKRLQGIITADAAKLFEDARMLLAKLYLAVMGRPSTSVSDGDTIEFLARGELATRRYLKELKRLEQRIEIGEEALRGFIRRENSRRSGER